MIRPSSESCTCWFYECTLPLHWFSGKWHTGTFGMWCELPKKGVVLNFVRRNTLFYCVKSIYTDVLLQRWRWRFNATLVIIISSVCKFFSPKHVYSFYRGEESEILLSVVFWKETLAIKQIIPSQKSAIPLRMII